MSIRSVKSYSERGSIKDIQNNSVEANTPATPFELRLKLLYENAFDNKNAQLINSLGLIVMDGNYRDPGVLLKHREYVKSLTLNSKNVKDEMLYSKYKKSKSLDAILDSGSLSIKVVGQNVSVSSIKRSFKRANEVYKL